MKDLLKSFEKGIGFGLGLLVLAILSLGVYAFVEPTSGPSVDYFVNPNSTSNTLAYVGDNVIPAGALIHDYVEVCFKENTTYYDTKSGGTTTNGGNCEPGDRGYVIDQDPTGSGNDFYHEVMQACAERGMRLPTAFEYILACENRGTWGFTVTDIASGGDQEFFSQDGFMGSSTATSDTPYVIFGGYNSFLPGTAPDCSWGGAGQVLSITGASTRAAIRCAK